MLARARVQEPSALTVDARTMYVPIDGPGALSACEAALATAELTTIVARIVALPLHA